MSSQEIKSRSNNAVQQVGNFMETGQKNPAGLVGTLAIGAIMVVGLAIKTIGDMSKK